ncbi:MAG: glycosyltransferase family 2 protein [Aliiglaciecola sp.]|uniref:glycosyltransferase family 2 protein n=1 Tax=Aliiglaciecola sp. TaxID=1872441 RepID=UPI0032972080
MTQYLPKISVVTAVYNGEKYVEHCIKSIVEQTYSNIEYVFIDGGSSDNTLNIANKYADKIDILVSEPDNGISDAMNKGIKACTGDYIIVIHSDDYLYEPETISRLVSQMEESDDVVLCNVKYGRNNSTLIARPLSWKTNFKGVHHQGSVCKRALFEKYGHFDETFKICMDYDFFLRIYRKGIRSKTVNITLSFMRDTGVSSQQDWQSLKARFDEERRVQATNPSTLLNTFIHKLYWLVYLPYRRLKYLIN